ncbi:hypothetical protein ABW19_dt0209334 [Dactylella cylindrospora]|nr:hypothetical protein ABW19_dt0209334 [Dactylella cylindrospora]
MNRNSHSSRNSSSTNNRSHIPSRPLQPIQFPPGVVPPLFRFPEGSSYPPPPSQPPLHLLQALQAQAQAQAQAQYQQQQLIQAQQVAMARTKQTARKAGNPSKDSSASEDNTVEEFVRDEDMDNQVKHLESRYDSQGYINLYEAGSAPPSKNQADKYRNFTFCCTQFFNRDGFPTQRTIDIKSRPVRDALKEMIVDYPGISFSTSIVTLKFPLHVLWYYQKQLNELADEEAKKESVLGTHLATLMKFLNDEFAPINKEYKSLTAEGLITYELAWTLFQPGIQVYTTLFAQQRVLKLKSFQYTSNQCGAFGALQSSYVDYDGTKFGEAETQLKIWAFDGTTKITDLPVIPLDRHPRKESIKKRLIERGTKFVALQGSHCKRYNGIAVENTMFGPSKIPINGRVMIDASTHAMFNPNEAKNLKAIIKAENLKLRGDGDNTLTYNNNPCYDDEYDDYSDYDDDGNRICVRGDPTGQDFDESTSKKSRILDLPDEHKLMCNALVWGYTLESKKWVQFFVDKIEEVIWNTESFSKLVLPETTKELIRGLVESHINENSQFDDFVEGKGKGLISVLHGAPGLGKTMTAETVAEYTKSPLYTVSAGSLGTDAVSLEKNLEKILKLCTIWKAVLLLDEADVYLEERSLHDIERNALVSIFLRLLEYYHGILFLTSNRVKTFDEAFQSRIHIALRYNDLTPSARVQVWKNFIAKIEGSGTETTIVEEDFKELEPIELNGRQIKNATRTALSIAARRGEKLGLEHLKIVLGVVDAFERDFRGIGVKRKSEEMDDGGVPMDI